LALDYAQILGLAAPASRAELLRRFQHCRAEALDRLTHAQLRDEACERLDQVHLAFRALSTNRDGGARNSDSLDALRKLIAFSLEEGLLRYSRRQRILEAAADLGISEFHVQLLVAQEQFGPHPLHAVLNANFPACDKPAARFSLRVAAVGVLTLALFMAIVRWAGAAG
jgi:hypothetical protein